MKMEYFFGKIRGDVSKYLDDALFFLREEKGKLISCFKSLADSTTSRPFNAEFDLKLDCDLSGLVDFFERYNGFLFRGQNDVRYQLIPSLYRGLCSNQIKEEVCYITSGLQGEQYKNFRDKAKIEGVDLIAPGTREEISDWQYGQHYGLKTAYLDWSENFHIALYFACRGRKSNSEFVSLFLINERAISILKKMLELKDAETKILNGSINLTQEDICFLGDTDFDVFLEKKLSQISGFLGWQDADLVFPIFYTPPYESNQRAKVQAGRFTNLFSHFSLEEWLPFFSTFIGKKLGRDISQLPLVTKINIPVGAVDGCLFFLDKDLNINEKALLLHNDGEDKAVSRIADECNSEIDVIKKEILASGRLPKKTVSSAGDRPGFNLDNLVTIG